MKLLQYNQPEAWNEDMREYLNDIRESGSVNMFSAGLLLSQDFNLDKDNARRCVLYWMRTFEDGDA